MLEICWIFWNIWNNILKNKSHLIFLDAEKVTGNLNCTFLFKILEDKNFGNNFIKWIRSICISQKAQIIVNDTLTKSGEIQK